MAERYKVEDLISSVKDVSEQWEQNESKDAGKDVKLQAELVCILIRCCAQFIRDNTPVISTVRFFFNDEPETDEQADKIDEKSIKELNDKK